jgi:ribosome biogenesis protein Nip4
MDKKRASRKPSGVNDNINDFLDRRETRKYGQRITNAPGEVREMNYMPGDMSKALRAKMAADRVMSGRTVEGGTRSMLSAMRNFMRGGGGSILRGR